MLTRFDRAGLRRWRARDAVVCVVVAALLLVLFEGNSVRKAGNQTRAGVGREVLLAVGKPAGWLSNEVLLASVGHSATAWLSPEQNLSGGSFATGQTASGAIPVVTPDAFDATSIGAKPAARRKLHTVLVTGDSMSEPLDDILARALDPKGVRVVEDPHLGTGISSTVIVNWGKLAASQVRKDHPEAVVVFIGANEGYSMPGPNGHEVACCSAEWAAIYANRARAMANTYRQAGAARVYWITLPTPREVARKEIATVVNAAIEVAVQPWADQVHIINSVPVFTPGNVYRDAMKVNGTQTIVRESDGVHLNEAGSTLLSEIVIKRLGEDFDY
jgi:hypothetical protein